MRRVLQDVTLLKSEETKYLADLHERSGIPGTESGRQQVVKSLLHLQLIEGFLTHHGRQLVPPKLPPLDLLGMPVICRGAH